MREYIVELVGTSKKHFSIMAESAEEASKSADIIMRKTNVIQFDNNDVFVLNLKFLPQKKPTTQIMMFTWTK